MIYSTEEKTGILKELISMAHADKRLKLEEVEFIKTIGKRLGFELKDLETFLESSEKNIAAPPKEFVTRIIRFHRLMLMMHIDGNVDERELQLLHEVALRYGIRRLTVLGLLEIMEKYPHGDIPPSELLSIHTQSNN